MSKVTRILIADDEEQMQRAISACLSRRGFELQIVGDGKQALEKLEQEAFDLVISDQKMPEMTGAELLEAIKTREMQIPLIMITAYGTINQAVQAMQLGAADFITKPFSSDDLERIVDRVLAVGSVEARSRSKKSRKGKAIITNDSFLIRMLEVAEAVARSDATVLIQGESGTGKELIARLIHSASPRHTAQFIAVNCAALPATLLESELFGHEKGAFTGAMQRKIGKFELAHGGTILLDEISEMELILQAKLLRVLQEREVDRVGGREPISVDVRVVATTNRNLEEMVKEGKFRADLYYRLNVIPLTLPALRERKGDIKLLVEYFMRQFCGDKYQPLAQDVLSELERYHWPGNVRELQNAVERAAILSSGHAPQKSDFLISSTPNSSLRGSIEMSSNMTDGQELDDSLMIKSGLTVQDMEKTLILETLKATNNNRTNAAKLLGISIRTLRNKLHEYKFELYESE